MSGNLLLTGPLLLDLLTRAAGRWQGGPALVDRLQRLPWQRLLRRFRLLTGLAAAILTPGLILCNQSLVLGKSAGWVSPFDSVIIVAYFTVIPVLVFATLVLIVLRSLNWTHWLLFVTAGAVTSLIAILLLPWVGCLGIWLLLGLSGTDFPNAFLTIVGFPFYMTASLLLLWLFPVHTMVLGAASGLSFWAVLHGRWPIQLLLAVVLVLPVLLVTWI